MEHLLTAWPAVMQKLQSARHILLLTDYDGTLTPIVARPELANLNTSTRLLLQALKQQRNITLGIISGRALVDITDRVDIKGIIYAGNHGLEIEGPGVSFIHPVAEEIRPVLRVIRYLLNQTLGKITGVIVEDKGLSIRIYYRTVGESQTVEVKNMFERVVGGTQALGKIRTTSGKKVYELRPSVEWDKGKAIKLLMKKYGRGGRKSGLLPIYMGDDVTDEDGFKIIEQYGDGISIFVGEQSHKTAARFYLKSPEEVELFLERFLESAGRGYR